MRTCAERDYSAQEVTHLVLGHKFYSSSRQFSYLNISQKEDNWIKLQILDQEKNTGHVKKTKLIDSYKSTRKFRSTYSLGNGSVVPSVNYILRAPIFLNFRNFGTKRDTTKKLKSNS